MPVMAERLSDRLILEAEMVGALVSLSNKADIFSAGDSMNVTAFLDNTES